MRVSMCDQLLKVVVMKVSALSFDYPRRAGQIRNRSRAARPCSI